MPLEAKIMRRLQQELEAVEDRTPRDGQPVREQRDIVRGPRLLDDARRLVARVDELAGSGVVAQAMDREALELACFTVQLPLKYVQPNSTRLGVLSLRDRCEQSAELMVMALAELAPDDLLDRAARLIHETPQRNPVLDEAKLLADAINLDDFGVASLFRQAISLALHGQGVNQLIESIEKRREYGYLDARLKDGFHFEASRQIAQKRMESAL
ncbi:MAG TPA: hypothetical protein PK402_03140, partial [Tepidisphaeraceae bacterium]|nr:hypothetical protein [Tepidisphaeraceae bacterium]